MEEIWKDIKDYESLYQVSNQGRIKRLRGKCKAKGDSYRNVPENILTLFPNKARANYLYVNLNNNGIKQFRVHKLVATAFIDNPENKLQINHIDSNKNNNSVSNLEWCTGLENMRHSFAVGTHKVKSGENAPSSKLTQVQVNNIKLRLNNKESGRSISKLYNISDAMVSLIKHNKNWKDDNSN